MARSAVPASGPSRPYRLMIPPATVRLPPAMDRRWLAPPHVCRLSCRAAPRCTLCTLPTRARWDLIKPEIVQRIRSGRGHWQQECRKACARARRPRPNRTSEMTRHGRARARDSPCSRKPAPASRYWNW